MMEGGSPKMIRQPLKVNQRTGIKQEFPYDAVRGYKSVAEPSIVTWPRAGRGTKGETVNSRTPGNILRNNWRPISS